jgi:curved DNA-binding protein CbpA
LRDYYRILGVPRDSRTLEIKRAFREKAKTMHPDVADESTAANRQFIILLEAYEVLLNPESRREYDTACRYNFSAVDEWNYRKFLKSRAEDPQSQAKLVCYDLLHDYEEEAIETYENLIRPGPHVFEEHVDREDFMDFAFLLAEHYIAYKCYMKAFRLLLRIVEYEQDRPYFRHFFPEVVDRLKSICTVDFPGDDNNALKIYILNQLVLRRITPKDTAYFYTRLAEAYSSIGDGANAAFYLQKAIEYDVRVPGIDKLRRKIGI